MPLLLLELFLRVIEAFFAASAAAFACGFVSPFGEHFIYLLPNGLLSAFRVFSVPNGLLSPFGAFFVPNGFLLPAGTFLCMTCLVVVIVVQVDDEGRGDADGEDEGEG